MRGDAPNQRAPRPRERGIGIRVRAFAKINLTLRVSGARPDGYHDLRTIFQTIALHDTLTFVRLRGPFEIECDDPACPEGPANLVWRAAEKMWRAAGRRGAVRDLRVRLRKRIPPQAGLGGGSTDAAAALRALACLWRVPADEQLLHGIAAELGADVPFFLHGGTALGVERGDLLFPLIDAPAVWVVLVLPERGVSTRDAFAWWDAEGAPSEPKTPAAAVRWSSPFPQRDFRNDLEAPVAARHPEIAGFVRALQSAGASYAAMSGSGSAVFGLFQVERAAELAARRLSAPSSRTVVTRTLSRSKYRTAAKPLSLAR